MPGFAVARRCSSTSRRMSRSSPPRTRRQDLGPSLSLDGQNPMPSPLIRSASYGGQTVNRLGEHFGIRTLLLEGGGHINGAFLQADLVDEVSLLVVPGIDGRHDIPAVFDV